MFVIMTLSPILKSYCDYSYGRNCKQLALTDCYFFVKGRQRPIQFANEIYSKPCVIAWFFFRLSTIRDCKISSHDIIQSSNAKHISVINDTTLHQTIFKSFAFRVSTGYKFLNLILPKAGPSLHPNHPQIKNNLVHGCVKNVNVF